MKHGAWFACLLVLSSLSPACSDSDDGAESARSSSPIVGTWKMNGFQTRTSGADWADIDDLPCRLDNTEEFGADGKWALYEGNTRCGQGGTGVLRGQWRLEASDTKIIFTYDDYGGEYESTIEKLTETELVYTESTGATDGSQNRKSYTKL